MAALPIVTDDLVEQVAHRFRLRDEARVHAFLREHPHLVPLVLEVDGAAQSSIGSGTAITLEVVSEPEDDTDTGTLYAFVQTKLKPEQARPLMKRFRDSWWTLASVRAESALNVALEYR